MIVTVELSLYPLHSEFEEPIINFIKALKSNPDIEVFTHSMSSYIKGEYDQVFAAIKEAYSLACLDVDTVSLVLKMVNRALPIEKGLLDF